MLTSSTTSPVLLSLSLTHTHTLTLSQISDLFTTEFEPDENLDDVSSSISSAIRPQGEKSLGGSGGEAETAAPGADDSSGAGSYRGLSDLSNGYIGDATAVDGFNGSVEGMVSVHQTSNTTTNNNNSQRRAKCKACGEMISRYTVN